MSTQTSDADAAYGPRSVVAVSLSLVVMAVVSLLPGVNPTVGWSLFLGLPLTGVLLTALGRGRSRQVGVGLAASGAALATAFVFGLLSSLG